MNNEPKEGDWQVSHGPPPLGPVATIGLWIYFEGRWLPSTTSTGQQSRFNAICEAAAREIEYLRRVNE